MPRGPKNLRIAFTDRTQTHFGGIYFLHEFVRLLQVQKRMAHAVKDSRPRTRYTISQMLLAIVYPVLLGLDRLEAAYFLRCNGIFQYLTGLPQFPNPTTLRRFLYHASPGLCEQVSRLTGRLTAGLLQRPHPRSRVLLDLDSTSLLVYGTHEGARRAYNPRRRGAKSYEPLIGFEANSGLFWAGLQRPGGDPGAREVIPFLKHSWAILPRSIREVRVRGDANFYSDDTLTLLEDRGAQYAIVARLTAPLKRRVTALRYRSLSAHWEVAETPYQATGWHRKRRIVAARKRLEPSAPQPTLLVLGRYAYHAYVTNFRTPDMGAGCPTKSLAFLGGVRNNTCIIPGRCACPRNCTCRRDPGARTRSMPWSRGSAMAGTSRISPRACRCSCMPSRTRWAGGWRRSS